MEDVRNTNESPLRNYKIGNVIGHGSFGKVKSAVHILTNQQVAIKILNRKKIEAQKMEEKVRRETKICPLLLHPHVIRVYEVIETQTDIYLVMEYMKGGELFDYIAGKAKMHEDEARRLFQQIISGVEYCHRNMVVHRDLKAENLLLDEKHNVKLADFGLSNIMRDGHFLRTSCGSPNYAAPEVILGKLCAGPEADVWSCGVILYALLCNYLPFDDENMPNLFRKIKNGVYVLPNHFSAGARDLIARMLTVDPLKRISTREICQHPWFKVHLPRYLAVTPPNAVEYLKHLDEEIIQDLIGMKFDRSQLIESLHKRIQNNATITYYLLLDNKSPMVTGYVSAELKESMEIHPTEPYSEVNALGFALGGKMSTPLSRNKEWLVGFQVPVDRMSPARPQEIMKHILATLQRFNVRWKKIGNYNMKCLSVHGAQYPESVGAGSNHYTNDIIPTNANILQPRHVLKFEMQLYKTRDAQYVVDLQRLSGGVFLFLDFCAYFRMHCGFD